MDLVARAIPVWASRARATPERGAVGTRAWRDRRDSLVQQGERVRLVLRDRVALVVKATLACPGRAIPACRAKVVKGAIPAWKGKKGVIQVRLGHRVDALARVDLLEAAIRAWKAKVRGDIPARPVPRVGDPAQVVLPAVATPVWRVKVRAATPAWKGDTRVPGRVVAAASVLELPRVVVTLAWRAKVRAVIPEWRGDIPAPGLVVAAALVQELLRVAGATPAWKVAAIRVAERPVV